MIIILQRSCFFVCFEDKCDRSSIVVLVFVSWFSDPVVTIVPVRHNLSSKQVFSFSSSRRSYNSFSFVLVVQPSPVLEQEFFKI